MARRVVRHAALAMLILLVIAVGLFLLRPWSAYSPLTMNSLFHPDKRVENFRHMDRIFPARSIKAGPTPFHFDSGDRPLPDSYTFNGQTRSVDEFLQRVIQTGLLVIQNDQIRHESYANGADATSLHTSWSVAKSFVVTLIGMAINEGRITSLDDPVSQYATSLAGSAYDGVPLRHVMRMASGVDFDEVYGSQTSDINTFFLKVFVLGKAANDVMHDYGRATEPGSTFDYVSIDTHVLGMVVSAVYQAPLADVVQQKLWQPLGMASDAFWNIDQSGESGVELGFCCLNATLHDYAKLGRLYLHDGVWNGERLLPEGWVNMATTPDAPWLAPGLARPHRGYAYQWWVPVDYQREYFAAGVWGQYVYVSEPDGLIIVRTSVDPDFTAHMAETVAVFRAIRDHYRND